MAVKAIFKYNGSSSNNPILRRSSETKAAPFNKAARGLLSCNFFPDNLTLPFAGYKPMIPFEIPNLPWPARPPIPKISPRLTSNDISRTISPGIFTFRCSILRAFLILFGVLFSG